MCGGVCGVLCARVCVCVRAYGAQGIPLVGPDTCAIKMNASLSYAERREMCIRWSQLGAFYPFARNHNKVGAPPQDPTAFGPEVRCATG